MSFKKNKYTIIRQAISKELASFVANYFSMQKQVYDTCKQTRYFSPFETILGYYESENEQIPNTYSHYADIAMETLMLKCQPEMEKVTGLKLYPAYTYARIYKKGLELDSGNLMLLDGLSNLYLMLGHTSKGLELKYKNTGFYKFNNNIFKNSEKSKIENINTSNFIGLSKILNPTLCDQIIDFFEEKKDLHQQGIVGERYDLSVKNSMDLTIHPSDFKKNEFLVFKDFLSELESMYKSYIQEYEVLKDFKTVKIPSFNIQKYNKGGHFAKIHCERSDLLTNHRLFAWMCYLNDVEDGGETYFKYFDKKFKPEKGNILLWPSEWTHSHSGLEVEKGEKYIITGWINII